MKKTIWITVLSIVHISIANAQINPEDLVIIYDSLNPQGKVVFKSNLESNLDSLSQYLLESKRRQLLTNLDSGAISTLLIGSWKLEKSIRITGEPYNLQNSNEFSFGQNRTFIQKYEEDIIKGNWEIKNSTNGNLILNFDEPQLSVRNKQLIKMLSKEQIASMTYSNNILSIKEINEQSLIFMTFIPINTENIESMAYRLVLTEYTKIGR